MSSRSPRNRRPIPESARPDPCLRRRSNRPYPALAPSLKAPRVAFGASSACGVAPGSAFEYLRPNLARILAPAPGAGGFLEACGLRLDRNSSCRPLWPRAAPRQRSTTGRMNSTRSDVRIKAKAADRLLWEAGWAGSALKVRRAGSGTPSPKPTTSRVPSEGNESHQIGGGVRHRRAQQRLVAIIRHAHREERAALER